jgi:tetratricopeptide (TPR) repeat protein
MEDERRLLQRTPTGMARVEDIKAAIMLHTEAHFASVSSQIPDIDSSHLERARRLLHGYRDLEPQISAAPEFVRQWFLLVIAHCQGMHRVGRSAEYLREARSLFPDSAEILLASGSHHELLAHLGRVSRYDKMGNRRRVDRVDRNDELRESIRYLRAAVFANPALHEAHLRLGRTLYLVADLEGAAAALQTVLSGASDEALRYLATIFSALIEEQRENRKRAADFYVQAMKLFPAAQAPYVGVSEVLYVDGQPDRAATVIGTLLDRPAPRDPWWAYLMGEWWHYDARLTAMRNRVK